MNLWDIIRFILILLPVSCSDSTTSHTSTAPISEIGMGQIMFGTLLRRRLPWITDSFRFPSFLWHLGWWNLHRWCFVASPCWFSWLIMLSLALDFCAWIHVLVVAVQLLVDPAIPGWVVLS